jgi:hypothetical protein
MTGRGIELQPNREIIVQHGRVLSRGQLPAG